MSDQEQALRIDLTEAPGELPKAVQCRREGWLEATLWLLALLLGFLQAWHGRFHASHGAVDLLDMGDAYFRGDRAMEVNGYFNPLYAWMLGAALHWLRPTAYWEFPVLHAVVFATYVLALFGFAFLLRELLDHREAILRRLSEAGKRFLQPPSWVWLVIGYGIFTWVSLDVIEVSQTNPDMLVAAFVYLASGLVVRIHRGKRDWLTFVLFGVVLGLGYLTKSAFLPLAFIFLGVAMFGVGKDRRAAGRLAIAALLFVLIAGPYVLALSRVKGRLTFGDAGRLNYAWLVNDVPIRHWQGSPEDGVPLHPTRQIFDEPATYEFGGPIGGTYRAVYDPSYWYEGLKTRFSLRKQLVALWQNVNMIGSYFLRLNGAVFLSVVVLALVSGRRADLLRDVRAYWFVLIPSLFGLSMYALVNGAGRYIGPFVAISALVPLLAIPLPNSDQSRRLMAGVAISIFLMLLSPIGPSAIPKYFGSVWRDEEVEASPWQIAAELRKVGLHPGDEIALTSYGKYQMEWARLARLAIVAEVYYSPTISSLRKNDFWRASPAIQGQILAAFARVGAKAAVSDVKPRWPGAGAGSTGGWQPLGATGLYVYRLSGGGDAPRQ
jgi:hypothetical protein